MIKNMSLLGSTGSIGTQALDVAENLNIDVIALTANKNISVLENQTRKFKPSVICISDQNLYKELKMNLNDCFVKVVCGIDGLCEVASLNADIVLNSVVGIAGLLPTMYAIENNNNVALANKETLVTGGHLVMEAAKKHNCKILPVDSEHSAIFQCIQGNKEKQISKIILTASGGPFFKKDRNFLEKATVEDALNHPNWNMGNKISIDSATMMNKGLELIEAVWLFDKNPKDIEIVIHPQSVLHSAVEYVDGSVIGQLSVPDMRLPIQYALTYPDRVCFNAKTLSLTDYENLNFYKPDYQKFKCIDICKEAITKGGLYPTIVNAANEVAVELFLSGKIGFLDIERCVEAATKMKSIGELKSISSILAMDKKTRSFVLDYFEI